jgi:hypothetical protein
VIQRLAEGLTVNNRGLLLALDDGDEITREAPKTLIARQNLQLGRVS